MLLILLINILSALCASGKSLTDADRHIPFFTMDGRTDCGVTEFLSKHETVFKCNDIALPEKSTKRHVLICFALYDTLYELCKSNKLDFVVPESEPDHFCEKSQEAFKAYGFDHKKPELSSWSGAVRENMVNVSSCSNFCFDDSELLQECSIIVAALNKLPKLKTAINPSPSGQSVSTEVVAVPKNPTDNTKSSPGVSETDALTDDLKTSELKKTVDSLQIVPNQTKERGDTRDSASSKNIPVAEVTKPVSQAVEAAKLPVPEITPEEEMEGELGPEDIPEQPVNHIEETPDIAEKSPYLSPEKQEQGVFLRKDDGEESNLITYFILMSGGGLLFYGLFHNKNKLLALALEGRRTSRRGGRCYSGTAYSKLNSNLEEAITSGPTTPSTTHVLY